MLLPMTRPATPDSTLFPDGQSVTESRIARLQAELAAVQSDLLACMESHERNHRALCAIADGIAIVDAHGRVTCLNPVASHLIGSTEDACLGRPLGHVVSFIDHQGRPMDLLAEGFCSDPDAIVSLIRSDGHVILVDGAVSPVHDRHKRPLGTVVSFRNVTASTRLARELGYHANHDPLTGLQNRRAFQAQLLRSIGNAREFGNGNALLYLDLDQFKAVNDSGGHLAGDELLRQLGVLLRKQLREHDTVARLGGDEFAVLLDNCRPGDAVNVAEKIRNAVIDFAFVWDGGEFRIGTSIGLVEFNNDERTVEDLIKLADSMCYVAKKSGRNRVTIYSGADHLTLPPGQDVSHRPGARRDENPDSSSFWPEPC